MNSLLITSKGEMVLDTVVEVWRKTLALLKRDLTQASYDVWVSVLTPVSFDNNVFCLLAPDKTAKEIVSHRHSAKIEYCLSAVCAADVIVRVLEPGERVTSQPTDPTADIMTYGTQLKARYVFDTFVKGKSNELAFAAAVAVAESPGRTRYNPLFLYGGVGLGKTHLMHSIGNYILHQDPSVKVIYTSAENMTNEFINSLKDRRNQEFRDKYRNIDVLLVDDIQFLSDKEGTQEEFFHTFNALYFANKQIVISSDKPPMELKTLEERLTSRFGSGLTVDITMPDYETRTAILEKKSELDNINVPHDVIRLIAKSVSSNIRELEGALNKVMAYARLTGRAIDIELAERALADIMTEPAAREVTVDYIQEVVGKYYNVTPEEIRSKRRTADISYARHVAMYLSRMLIDTALLKIGSEFGNRDHTTVIHACNKIGEELERNPQLRETLIMLEKRIKSERV